MCKLWCLITTECLLFFAVQRLITWFVWLTSATILSSVNNGHKYTYPVGHIDTLRALFPFGFIYAFHFLALICPALLPRNFSFNLIFFFFVNAAPSRIVVVWLTLELTFSFQFEFVLVYVFRFQFQFQLPLSPWPPPPSPLVCVIEFSQFVSQRFLSQIVSLWVKFRGPFGSVLLIGKSGDELYRSGLIP